MSAKMLEVSLSGVGTVLRLERDDWSMAKWLIMQGARRHAPPAPREVLWCWRGKYRNDNLQRVAQRYIRYHLPGNIFKVYINGIVVAVEAQSRESRWGRRQSVGIDVCGWFRGKIRNARRIAETNRESSTPSGNGELQRKKVCSTSWFQENAWNFTFGQ